MMVGAKAHRYVGLSEIYGVPCHHLIVGQEDVVWQIWIEEVYNDAAQASGDHVQESADGS